MGSLERIFVTEGDFKGAADAGYGRLQKREASFKSTRNQYHGARRNIVNLYTSDIGVNIDTSEKWVGRIHRPVLINKKDHRHTSKAVFA